ncbi:hypothetical protein V6N13_084037 [Hibiscus sabdariffa]|uniref:Uncharacterized protein n=1 Tax=Hibiscus sabdariffa TaxID=183260 RepID=A0ABR2SZV0_9ROSI
MRRVIGQCHGDADGAEIREESWVFCNLQILDQLESICRRPLCFASVRATHVFDCPKLKKLSFHITPTVPKTNYIVFQDRKHGGIDYTGKTRP